MTNEPKEFKTPLSVRGDNMYCPLPLALDSYYSCEIDCHHCYFRRLNHVWGNDLRVTDSNELLKKLVNGLNNSAPQSKLSYCLSQKKTIRIGNKSDPLQPCEDKYKATLKAMRILTKLRWSYVIQTRFTERLMRYERLLSLSDKLGLVTLMPIISPGLSKDWELLERKRTTPIPERLKHCQHFIRKGFALGVNGEPFIPGFHTVSDFEKTIRRLKAYGVKSYNTYNFHWNDFIAKRLHAIGIDIEKIWYHNRDEYWKPILQQLIDIAKKHNIILGCPDFVNTGPNHRESVNTCCGIQVPNPCTYNTHFWKHYIQGGRLSLEEVEEMTWDNVGDREEGRKIITGKPGDFFSMKDAGVLPLVKNKVEE